MNSENVIEQLQKRFVATLSTTLMPSGNISFAWFKMAKLALKSASIKVLGISIEDFTKLVDAGLTELTMMQASILINNLECCSAKDLDVHIDEYISIMHKTITLGVEWKQEADRLRSEMTEQLAAEHKGMKSQGTSPVGVFGAKPAEA